MSTLSSVPEEEYRPVVGYEGLYEVSNLGNVRSLPRLVTDTSEILAAVYLAGTENGLGKIITDTSEIMHRKEAFIKANPVCKEAVALINQQIKSVLDELEDEAEAFERTSKERDGLTHFAVPLSPIQKIRSRYE